MAELPMAFILAGIAAYTVLAGADFGAGLWILLSRRVTLREHARHAMGPVWEANHVWLVFVLVVCWTAYPVAFGSIASTLSAPLFLAAIGIVLRGTSYALRGQLDAGPGRRAIENVFALSSILTPFALGAAVGGIASGRVPIGNAAGDLVTSWLNPTSILVGILAVAVGGHLAAVYLAADAHRLGERHLERDFRARALGSGVVAGAVALAGLPVVRADAPALFDGLTRGGGAAAVVVSALAGLGTLALVRRRRFELSRGSAALAVAAIVAGWALAQRPWVLPGLTVEQAAASSSTLRAVVLAVVIGAVVLVPSLVLLFRLVLAGRLDPGAVPRAADARLQGRRRPGRLEAAFAVAALLIGGGLTLGTDGGWPLGIGVVGLLAGGAAVFVLAVRSEPREEHPDVVTG